MLCGGGGGGWGGDGLGGAEELVPRTPPFLSVSVTAPHCPPFFNLLASHTLSALRVRGSLLLLIFALLEVTVHKGRTLFIVNLH